MKKCILIVALIVLPGCTAPEVIGGIVGVTTGLFQGFKSGQEKTTPIAERVGETLQKIPRIPDSPAEWAYYAALAIYGFSTLLSERNKK